MWIESERYLIHDILKLIDKNCNKEIYIETLEKILCDRESKVNEYIRNKSSSYDV
jgi:hypothetical protein